MAEVKTDLGKRIESAAPILLAEVSPPPVARREAILGVAARYAGKVHALGLSDNRE